MTRETSTVKGIRWAMWPKIIQINEFDVFIIGGNDTNQQNERNIYHQYRNFAAVLKVNIETGLVTRCEDMIQGR